MAASMARFKFVVDTHGMKADDAAARPFTRQEFKALFEILPYETMDYVSEFWTLPDLEEQIIIPWYLKNGVTMEEIERLKTEHRAKV
jgi:hypothetical protein